MAIRLRVKGRMTRQECRKVQAIRVGCRIAEAEHSDSGVTRLVARLRYRHTCPDFSVAPTGEARMAGREETESSGVRNEFENPASKDCGGNGKHNAVAGRC